MKIRKLLKGLRLSVKDNSSAYGFSIMITGSYALLATLGEPGPLKLFAGAAGAVLAFSLSEIAALTILRHIRDDHVESTRFLARILSFISVGFGMGAAYACALLLSGPWGWFAAGFCGTFLFVFLEGLELAAAEAGNQKAGEPDASGQDASSPAE